MFGEVEVTVRGVVGDSFLLLQPPAVLTDFKGEGLRVAKVEREPRMEGNRLVMILQPKNQVSQPAPTQPASSASRTRRSIAASSSELGGAGLRAPVTAARCASTRCSNRCA